MSKLATIRSEGTRLVSLGIRGAPPVGEFRFWLIQGLVAAITLVHLWLEWTEHRGELTGFVDGIHALPVPFYIHFITKRQMVNSEAQQAGHNGDAVLRPMIVAGAMVTVFTVFAPGPVNDFLRVIGSHRNDRPFRRHQCKCQFSGGFVNNFRHFNGCTFIIIKRIFVALFYFLGIR